MFIISTNHSKFLDAEKQQKIAETKMPTVRLDRLDPKLMTQLRNTQNQIKFLERLELKLKDELEARVEASLKRRRLFQT